MISALLTLKVLVDSEEELANIEKFRLALIRERPGLCWEVMKPLEEEESHAPQEEGNN